MNDRRRSEISAEERAEIFHETFDASVDAGVTLAGLVRAAGDYLGTIVGPDVADAAMAKIIEPLAREAGSTTGPATWREALAHSESYCFSSWPFGAQLHDLAAYAHFGIALASEDDAETWLRELVEGAVKFRDSSPIDLWLDPSQASPLEEIVLLAENRWALDNNRPIDPRALSKLGGVSEGRMRNMMSGSGRTFSNEDGKIPAHEAIAWLAGRDSFWNSIWRDQQLPQYRVRHRPPLEHPVFVPVARDGSVFHPGLNRGGTYTIGEKSDERHLADFDEALAELQEMPAPYWRRPNTSGHWGTVRGVRWARLDQVDLETFAANPQQRLSETDG
jgi:hypothetical protein